MPENPFNVIQDIGCSGGNDGEIDVTVSGGTLTGNANYTYVMVNNGWKWFNSREEDQSGLGPGTYSFCDR